MIIAKYVAVALIGYLIGSIPFGLWISRRQTGTDITQVGSGKIGTTNVLRTAGKKAAALVLILDMAKGFVPVLLAELIFGGQLTVTGASLPWMAGIAQVLAALTAIAGHSWSLFLRFRGGRGVATFTGGLVAMYWPAALLGGAIIIAVGSLTRYMSLGSISGAISAFILLTGLTILQPHLLAYVIYTMICAIFIFVMHRDNIVRLTTGTERRLGEKADFNSPPQANHHR